MADADNQDTASTEQNQKRSVDKVEQELASVKSMLEQFNQTQQSLVETLVKANQKAEPRVEDVADDDIYDPKRLTQKVLGKTEEVVNQALQRERAMNAMIATLASDYPEISRDPDVQKQVKAAHAALPTNLQGTAEGYEMAVLRAVSKAGLVPKSLRQSVDEDISAGGSSGGGGRSERKDKKVKVTENTLIVAQLLGRDVNDPKVMKGLEEAAKRNSWSKYR